MQNINIRVWICYKTHEGPFFFKNPSIRFFPQKRFESVLSIYTAVTFCKKLEKAHALIFEKLEKPHFGPASFDLKTSKKQVSHEKSLKSVYVTFT